MGFLIIRNKTNAGTDLNRPARGRIKVVLLRNGRAVVEDEGCHIDPHVVAISLAKEAVLWDRVWCAGHGPERQASH